jgi:hypothetical protein
VLKDFGPYGIIIMNVRVVMNCCHGNVVKDFGPYGMIIMNVRVVITVAMVMLFRILGLMG